MSDGIELRHITRGCNVPMYRTSIATQAAGPFHGPLVVSMRPMTPEDAKRAVEITGRYPKVHGAPIQVGAAGEDRHLRCGQTRLRRRGTDQAGRNSGVLGLRRHTAIGDRDHEAGILHHALSRQHAGDGPQEFRICDNVVGRRYTCNFLEYTMKKLAVAIFLVLLSVAVHAAEVWVDVATDIADGAIWSLDSSGAGIIDLGNKKTAYFKKRWPAQNKTITLWVTFECNSNRYMIGETRDITIDNSTKTVKGSDGRMWLTYNSNTVGKKMHDAVCR